MTLDRRTFLEQTTRLSLTSFAWMSGLITPDMVSAAERNGAFVEKTADQIIAILAGRYEVLPSEKIHLKVPDTAENGAIVPITFTSTLDNVQSVAIIAERNPIPLVGQFKLENEAEPFIQARIKMAESSHVIAIVNAANHLFTHKKYVNVTVGGCGS